MATRRGPVGPSTTTVRVQVFRVPPSSRNRARLLSNEIGGILTHYTGGKSEYCRGLPACPWHRGSATWRGYTPVEIWEPTNRRWIPWVLEVTEALELDMRGRYRRGQVWELSRDANVGKKIQRVNGELIEEGHGVTVRPPFDMMPVLLTMYHCSEIVLGVENPMPAPVVLEIEPAAGVEPAPRPAAKPAAAAAPTLNAADLEKLRAARRNIGREVHNGKAAAGHP